MIHLKIGKIAAKTEIKYQSANELDDPSDSSETRKLCENWWGHRRKRRGESADEPQVSWEEEPDRSDRKRRRAAASSVVKATDPRDEGEPASNPVVLTPNIWEDGPTHVRFAHCRNMQGPEKEALEKSLAEWKASQEKKWLKKMKAKERRQKKAKSKQKLVSKPAPNREQAATTAEKKTRSKKRKSSSKQACHDAASSSKKQSKRRAGAEVEFVFRMKTWTPYSTSIEDSAKIILTKMLELCEDRFPCGIRRETTTSTSLLWASPYYRTTKHSRIPGAKGSTGCVREIQKIVDVDFTEAHQECLRYSR